MWLDPYPQLMGQRLFQGSSSSHRLDLKAGVDLMLICAVLLSDDPVPFLSTVPQTECMLFQSPVPANCQDA